MITDPCLYMQVLLIDLLTAPGVWPQTPAPVPVRFLTRIRAAMFSSSTPCIHCPFPFVSYQRSLRSPTPLRLILNLVGLKVVREEVR